MISEEKLVHIVHLMVEGVQKAGLVEYSDHDAAIREARRAALLWLKQVGGAEEDARKRILTQKNPPMENTPQWDNLYQKYLEDELKKRGG